MARSEKGRGIEGGGGLGSSKFANALMYSFGGVGLKVSWGSFPLSSFSPSCSVSVSMFALFLSCWHISFNQALFFSLRAMKKARRKGGAAGVCWFSPNLGSMQEICCEVSRE